MRLEEIKSDWYNEDSIDNENVGWLIEQAERTNDLNIKYENGLLQYHLVKDSNRILAERVEELEKKQEYYETHLNEPYIKSLQEDSSKYRKIIALYHKGNDYQIIDFLRDLKRIITGKESDGEKL